MSQKDQPMFLGEAKEPGSVRFGVGGTQELSGSIKSVGQCVFGGVSLKKKLK